MKRIIFIVSIALLAGCVEDKVSPGGLCDQEATVVDLTGLDGCGYVLQLEDGSRFEPVWKWGLICGTPPIPVEILEDPLFGFQFEAGQKVRFSYELFDGGTICMAGTPVVITCIEEISSKSDN